MSEFRYKLTITKTQARALTVASELLARLGMGQWRDAMLRMPLKKDLSTWHEDLEEIGRILSKHIDRDVKEYTESLGVGSGRVSFSSKDAWDIYQVLRHKMSWDDAIMRGLIMEGDRRDFSTMWAVDYDSPLKISEGPLPLIEAVNG